MEKFDSKSLRLSFVATVLITAFVFNACSNNDEKSNEVVTQQYDPHATIADKEDKEMEVEKAETAESKVPKKTGRKPAAIPKRSAEIPTYIVQIGAFTKKENAEQLLNELKEKNYPVFLKTLDHKDFGRMFLVRLKPMNDRAAAETLLTQLQDNEKLKPTIIIPKKD